MADITPRNNDVLFGRGYAICAHPGNQILRCMVRAHKPLFLKTKKPEKRDIARKIVGDIQYKLGGRFLTDDPDDHVASQNGSDQKARKKDKEWIYAKAWICVDTEKAVSKVMHRLRENDKNSMENKEGEDPELLLQQMEHQLQQIHLLRQQNARSNGCFSTLDNGRVAVAATGAGGGSTGHTPSSTMSAGFLQGPTGLSTSQGGVASTAVGSSEFMSSFLHYMQQMELFDLNQVVNQQFNATNVMSSVNRSDGISGLNQATEQAKIRCPPANLSSYVPGEAMKTAHNTHQQNGIPPQLNFLPPQPVVQTSSILSSNSKHPSANEPLGKLNDTSTTMVERLIESSNITNRNLFFLEASNSITSFPVSAGEFLKAGCLKNRMVLLEDNDALVNANTQAVGPPSPERSNGDGSKDRLVMENAARMALLLARSFVGRLPGINLESIQLDDFSIHLKQEVGGEHVNDPSCITSSEVSKWILLWIDLSVSIITPDICEEQNTLEVSAGMTVLGKLLYSVFSLGGLLPSALLTGSTTSSRGEAVSRVNDQGEEDNTGRSSKMFRTQKSTVFSKLIESNSLPDPICRLISDMVDTGPKSQVNHPIRLYDDVIQDLECMVHQPEIFLHNSLFSRGMPPPPMFGHTYHGRGKDVATLRKVAYQMEESLQQTNTMGFPNNTGCLDAIFVSGIAGSGKSHLIQTVIQMLRSPGWIVIKAKFERGKEHISKSIVSFMFDQLIVNLVKMKGSERPSDVAYSRQASKLILDAIGYSRLALLVDFLPSLRSLFPGLDGDKSIKVQAEENAFRLIYSISKIIEALLESSSDRLMMICCDDLQWADKTSLALIVEILVNVASFGRVSPRCLFVGLFRHDEIDDNHPFSVQYTYLQMMTEKISTTKIELSSLSKEDIGDVLMAELGLPRRYVAPLADVVHKKTSGHALFAVELLNSLVRSSTVAYSTQIRRYAWDQDTINIIQTGAGVAGLIASNLKSLPPSQRRVLQILSCFGIQTDTTLLQYLENFQNGIVCSTDDFIEQGILDRAGPIVIFTHDLIQQAVYESMSLNERKSLHLDIGQFLGERANIDDSATSDPETSNLDRLQLDTPESSLISIACDQIDFAGPDAIGDDVERFRFATWNLFSGRQAHRQSNSGAALYYFSKGISFLGRDCWHASYNNLCLSLHKGAVTASFTLGKPDDVAQYAEQITKNVAFDDSLDIQPFVLRSLSQSGQHEESISKGIQILHRLKFDIPLAPTPESVMKGMASTNEITSKFSTDQMMDLCGKTVDDTVHRAVMIIDAFYTSCYVASSPFLPLISCAVIQFSLQHGICHEALAAFAAFATMKIFLAGDYDGGRYWANIVRAMTKKLRGMAKSNMNMETHAHLLLHVAVDIWFQPPKEISQNMITYHHNAMKMGQVHIAVAALGVSCRYLLLGGENLSLLQQLYDDKFRLVAKHSKSFVAKYMALDSILLTELTGKSGDYFSVFNGSICNIDDLKDEAKATKDFSLLQSCHVFNVLINYWRGNYMAAEEHSRLASMMYPACKEPTIYLIYHTFYRALILFKRHRISGSIVGSANNKLKDGKEMMDLMGRWSLLSKNVFNNKWLLLKAEYAASVEKFDEALQMYKDSIKSAQDHGNIQELALAHELLGDYYSDRGCHLVSIECFKNGYLYYTQWGATAIAERILRKHNLDVDIFEVQNRKHSR